MLPVIGVISAVKNGKEAFYPVCPYCSGAWKGMNDQYGSVVAEKLATGAFDAGMGVQFGKVFRHDSEKLIFPKISRLFFILKLSIHHFCTSMTSIFLSLWNSMNSCTVFVNLVYICIFCSVDSSLKKARNSSIWLILGISTQRDLEFSLWKSVKCISTFSRKISIYGRKSPHISIIFHLFFVPMRSSKSIFTVPIFLSIGVDSICWFLILIVSL